MNNQESIYQKSFSLWRQFGETYTKNMLTAVEKNLKQTKAVQEQMQDAINQMVNSQYDFTLNSLKNIENQTKDLTKAWDEMAKEPVE